MTNSVLSSLPLPATLDPHRPVSLPSRLRTLFILIRDTLSSLVRLPFFVLPLAIHLPAYVLARYGARLGEDDEENQAQAYYKKFMNQGPAYYGDLDEKDGTLLEFESRREEEGMLPSTHYNGYFH